MSRINQNVSHQIVATGTASMSSAQTISHLLGCSDVRTSEQRVFSHRRVRTGQCLVRAGDEFRDLFIVRVGCFKTVFTDQSGHEQIMNFPVKGTLLGADGIGSGQHVNDVVALTDAEVVVVPFNDLNALTTMAPRIEEPLFRAISRQLIEEQLALTAIGSLCAETRLARFLVGLGNQMKAQGYSRDEFVLQMSRQDIGNYLSMKIETVSRTLTALVKKGVIRVDQREISIANRELLDSLADGSVVKKSVGPRRSVASLAAPGHAGCANRTRAASSKTPWSGLVDLIAPAEVAAV